MFSSMAQNLGHFLRIFRVLHTVQFSRSFAADSSGRSRSQRQLWYSIISSAVCQQLFISFFSPFSRKKLCPVARGEFYNIKRLCKCQPLFSFFSEVFRLIFPGFFQVLPRQQNRVEARPSSHYIFHSFPFSSLLIFGRPLYRSHHYRGCYAAVAAAVTAAAIFLS